MENRILMVITELFLRAEIREEVQGDILENFYWRKKEKGLVAAYAYFALDIMTIWYLPARFLQLSASAKKDVRGTLRMALAIGVVAILLSTDLNGTLWHIHSLSRQLVGKSDFVAINPVIPTRDIGKTAGFYLTKLGFEEVYNSTAYQEACLDYMVLCRGDICLHLQQTQAYADFTAPHIRLEVRNIRELWQEFKGSGAIPEDRPLVQSPWNTIEFGLYDPNSVALTFYESI